MDFFVDLLISAIGAVAFIAISRAFGLFERAFFAGGLLVAAVAYVGFGMAARSASELTVELGGSALFAALGALGLVCSMWFHDKGSIDKSRRAFVKTAALGGAALASSVALGTRSAEARVGGKAAAGKPSTPQIKLAGYPLDRVQGLIDGRVQVEGCDIRFESVGIAKLNATAIGGSQGWEVQEIGLHPYMLAYANGSLRDYSLIPVFPLRTFRHKSIFVRSDRGIRKPEDLRGKKVGVSAYAQSSLVWIRGILEHEYGVKPEEMHWVVSSRASEGKVSKNESVRPKAVPIEDGPAGKDESELLVEGAIDAVFAAKEPQAFIDGNPIVRRLFPDSRATEQAYFEKTRIFPIMHAVAIRNDAIEKYPWLPKRTFEAYSQSKSLMYHDIRDMALRDHAG